MKLPGWQLIFELDVFINFGVLSKLCRKLVL